MPNADVEQTASLAGPRLKAHRCTDPICFLIYAAACLGLLVCAGYGAAKGNTQVLERYLYGVDHEGHMCGKNDEVKEFPLTYYALHMGNSAVDWNSWQATDRKNLVAVCTSACPKESEKPHAATSRGQDLCNKKAVSDGVCSTYGGSSIRVANYCLDMDVFLTSPSTGGFFADLAAAKWIVACVPIISIALATVFLFLLYKCGICVVWIGTLFCILAPVFLGIFFFVHASNSDPDDALNSVIPTQAQFNTAYVLWAAGAVMALFSLCLCSTINQAGKILSFTSEFIRDVPSQMLHPVAFGIAQLIVLLIGLAILVVVASVNAESPSDSTSMQDCITNGDFTCVKHLGSQGWLEFYVVAVTIWIMTFCSALSHYATAWSFSHWYFASTDPNENRMPFGKIISCCDFMITIKGICSGLGNHVGSLAVGSFAVTCCKLLRICLFWASRSDDVGGNIVTHCIRCIVNCIASCIENCVQFVTEHTYVEIAITGRGFCRSMRRAMALAASRPDLFAVVSNVALALEVAGPLIVAFGTGIIVFLVLIWIPPAAMTGPSAPVVVAFVVGLFIGEVMVHPVATSCRAAAHCFVLDEEQTEEHTGTKGTRHTPSSFHGFVDSVSAGPTAQRAGSVTLS